MKKKSNGKICLNQLASLLNIRFNTKTTPSFDLTVINDFPKLKKKQLISGIFWGTFQLRLCKSYISDLLLHHECFFFDNNIINSKEDSKRKKQVQESRKSKLIGIEISSRHKRGEIKKKSENDKAKMRMKYKVIIQYEPLLNTVKSIKSKLKHFF